MKKIALMFIAALLSLTASVYGMSAIRNRTSRPIFLRLESGKTVRLNPGKSEIVTDKDLKNPIIVDLVKKGEIVIEKDKGGK